MRITSIQDELLCEIPFLNAGKGPGAFTRELLPVHLGLVDHLPTGVSAILVTSDLQGRETFESAGTVSPRLLGEVLPGVIAQEIMPSLGLKPGRVGALLAGDFYTVPALDRRGGTGDVSMVWQAFANQFDWVVGVAGNHDLFGDTASRPRFSPPVHFLDSEVTCLENTTIAGLSGIPGNPRRPWRQTEQDYINALELLLCESPTILIMHEGPELPAAGYPGSTRIRRALEQSEPTLVIRGHSHWHQPLGELANGTQVLNVDFRAVILTAETLD